MSNYRMQIIDIRDGHVARWRAGGAIETDFPDELCRRVEDRGNKIAEELCARLKKRGVGIFVPQEAVLAAVAAEVPEVIESQISTIIREEFAWILMNLKSKV